MTYEEMIAVIDAERRGRLIQAREFGSQTWENRISLGGFNFRDYEYRVPAQVWVVYGVNKVSPVVTVSDPEAATEFVASRKESTEYTIEHMVAL